MAETAAAAAQTLAAAEKPKTAEDPKPAAAAAQAARDVSGVGSLTTPSRESADLKDTTPLLNTTADAAKVNEAEFEKKPPLPGQTKHHCTDIGCLLIFLAAVGGLVYTIVYAAQNGDWRRLQYGYDYRGQMCGVQAPGELLFWCSKGPAGGLDLLHPICVDACPADENTSHVCYGGISKAGNITTSSVSDYATVPFGGKYCMPTNFTLAAGVVDRVFRNPVGRVLTQAMDFSNAWKLLIAAGAASLVVGYTYLFLIEYLADQVVYGAIGVMVVAPLFFGVLFVLMSIYGRDATLHALPLLHGSLGANVTIAWEQNSVLHNFMYGGNSVFNQRQDMTVGILCLLGGVCFLSVLFCARLAIARALAWVEAATDCIFQVPSLLLEPLLFNVFKVAALTGLGVGFVRLLTVGQLAHHEQFGGVYFTYSALQWALIAFYLFMAWWIAEVMTATSQFVHAYAAQLWYFTPYEGERKKRVPRFCTIRGYDAALSYHLGSLALGALLIGPTRVPRAIMGFLAAHTNSMTSYDNPLLSVDSHACDFVGSCYRDTFEWLSKNAYMDMAVTSSSFMQAAKRAYKIIVEEAPPVAGLSGGKLVSESLGYGLISGVGAAVAWFLVNSYAETFYPTSPSVVRNPVFFSIIGGLIGFAVAENFMSIFDTVGDALMYCFAIDHRREGNGKLAMIPVVRPDVPASATQEHAGGCLTACFACCTPKEDPEEQRYESVYAPKKFQALLQPGGSR